MTLPFLAFLLLGILIGWLVCRFQMQGRLREVQLEKRAVDERLALVEKMHVLFSDQFKGISSEALKHNNESFMQVAEQVFEKKHTAIDKLIQPVKETLERFEVKIQDLEKSRVGSHASLKEQVQSLIESQKELRKETSNLSRALRAPNVRGRWGEMQLKRVVEIAGMIGHCDFFEQSHVTVDEKGYRPDMLIKLPGGKNIVIDAKAPLNAYLEAIETPIESLRVAKFKEHAQQIRAHITFLSRKSYWEQFEPTPEFVILFLPGEPFFSAALEQEPTLIEMGVEQKVILATPTTLIALLRAVAYGWRQESLSENAERISALGRELYKRLEGMSGHFGKVGKGLTSAVQAYNKTVASFESRVLSSARRFNELGEDREIESIEPIEQITREIVEK